MSTTLPFGHYIYNGNGFFSTGSQLVYVDYAYQKTWFSSDGLFWSSVNWGVSSTWYDGMVEGCYIAPYAYGTAAIDLYGSTALFLARSTDFITWTIQVYEDSRMDLSPFSTQSVIGHSGTIYRFTHNGSYITFISTTPPASVWSAYTASNLPVAQVAPLYGLFGPAILSAFGAFWSLPPGNATYKKIYTSSDAISWTIATSDWGMGTSGWRSYVVTPTLVTILLGNGETWDTPDMLNWTLRIPATVVPDTGMFLLPLGADLFCVSNWNAKIYKLSNYYTPSPIGHPL